MAKPFTEQGEPSGVKVFSPSARAILKALASAKDVVGVEQAPLRHPWESQGKVAEVLPRSGRPSIEAVPDLSPLLPIIVHDVLGLQREKLLDRDADLGVIVERCVSFGGSSGRKGKRPSGDERLGLKRSKLGGPIDTRASLATKQYFPLFFASIFWASRPATKRRVFLCWDAWGFDLQRQRLLPKIRS